MGIISGILAMFGWGTADFLAAKASRKLGNLKALFWMQIIGFVIALIYFFARFSSFDFSLISKYAWLIIGVGILETFGYLAYYKGLEKAQVSLVTPIGASWAMIVTILSAIFLKEVLSGSQIFAILLIIFGTIFVSLNLGGLLKAKRVSVFKGTKEGLLAMLSWGAGTFLLVYPIRIMGWFLPVLLFKIVGILFLLGVSLFRKEKLSFKPKKGIVAILVPIGILDVLAYFIFTFGISGHYASIVAPVAASFPIITILLARMFLKERVFKSQAVGIIAVILGIILISL